MLNLIRYVTFFWANREMFCHRSNFLLLLLVIWIQMKHQYKETKCHWNEIHAAISFNENSKNRELEQITTEKRFSQHLLIHLSHFESSYIHNTYDNKNKPRIVIGPGIAWSKFCRSAGPNLGHCDRNIFLINIYKGCQKFHYFCKIPIGSWDQEAENLALYTFPCNIIANYTWSSLINWKNHYYK